MARIGLAARGAVYGVIGILALELALGAGGKTENQSGAMKTLARQPLGDVLLIAVAIGLGCYAAWRLIEGTVGSRPDEDASVWHRVSAVASGVAYGVLCYIAISIIDGSGSSNGSPRPATAGVLGWPGGPVLVAIVGGAIIGVGIYQGYKGLSRRFEEEADVDRMGPRTRAAYATIGVAGQVARAVTFAVIGYGLIKAAFDYSAKSAVGLDGALQRLAHAALGPLLLGLVALGFVAFALYSLADARYRKV